jgi:glycosyltransferase involved in cell wall biosynthesis
MVVPVGDPAAMASAMEKIFSGGKTRDNIMKNAKSFVARFDWDRFAKEFIAVMRRVE